MRLIWIATCWAIVVFGGQASGAQKDPSTEVAVVKAQVLEQKAADKESIAPLPQAATITKSEIQAVDPAGAAPVDDAITCLSRTIYWEAKGGTSTDMEDVANVILNRIGHDGFPGTICEVVKQGAEKKVCQFSWWCDGRSDQVDEDDRYTAAKEIARKALNQQLKDRTGGAMYFHDKKVNPSWAKEYIKTTETDTFLFYKPHDGKAK
ncbi:MULTISPECIES: cell wall hydrolase [unclassified Pseudomonas]|uniref:cell wall hydrolase n=1 Tax=unclassified Pseudomonas TaxID=196821 RepID=UPI002AC9D081|nr:MULTISPECIES: cell wall hydrolase [unclassified Pseudomonas]MEB0039801.1 cell wall hydrolase [Pseudomonas sp. MH10]MEB0077257.1 cell wall hydrolase [Pseudomonas sp. MH10out]MEB0091412.1 cell wall hydrolase [Pseudomonas sp. CCI4.2]MEB0101604.1 cell wall hydrolase [Pseudomonas sp. CCI3.2]MEB0120713.1 cell wall hydrolase [Pseudomonas sp. CCI1.2]